MKAEDVLAVVVSYNGREKTKAAVQALRDQVGHIHIVDNGSSADSLAVLESLEEIPNVSVCRLNENRGVGYALNAGVKRARELGYSWLLTMDQDSLVDRDLIRAYQAALERDPTSVCLTPMLEELREAHHRPDEVTGYAITSGNLVRMTVFDRIGLYDEGFFIDCIDFDFCLRLRRSGYAIRRVSGASMVHELGEPVRMPRLVKRYYARHSPTRRYYMYRNFMYMVERYFRDFPVFISKLALAQLLLTVLIGFLDLCPIKSYRAVADGIADYFARKDGRYIGGNG